MSGKLEEDPYYSLRNTVQDEIDRIQTNHKKFQSILKSSDTSSSSEFKDLRKGLTQEVKKVDGELNALKSMCDMVDKNRGNFGHIKDSELESRKRFISSNIGVLKNVRESVNSEEVRKKIEEDKQKSQRNPMQMTESQREKQRQLDNENSAFINSQHTQVREQLNQQDRNLELLGGAIDNVHVKAKLINEEIKEQNVMIDKLGEDVDAQNEKMNVVIGALAKLLKTKDSCQVWTIVILGVVLILLVCLVIWT